MIFTTTPNIEGKNIKEYKGIVTSEVIFGANIFRDFFAGIRDVIGGRTGSYEKVLIDAKKQAFEELQKQAEALGANAVVGIDFDFETLGSHSSMLLVHVSGTAVVVE